MDISLIPSRFEPAALSAMYNLKYGALPVARVTGGIQEIIEDYDPTTDSGYGFLCYEYSSDAFWDAVKRARQIFRDQRLWTKLMKRAMARNFSWDVSAQRYEALYGELVGHEPKPPRSRYPRFLTGDCSVRCPQRNIRSTYCRD